MTMSSWCTLFMRTQLYFNHSKKLCGLYVQSRFGKLFLCSSFKSIEAMQSSAATGRRSGEQCMHTVLVLLQIICSHVAYCLYFRAMKVALEWCNSPLHCTNCRSPVCGDQGLVSSLSQVCGWVLSGMISPEEGIVENMKGCSTSHAGTKKLNFFISYVAYSPLPLFSCFIF